ALRLADLAVARVDGMGGPPLVRVAALEARAQVHVDGLFRPQDAEPDLKGAIRTVERTAGPGDRRLASLFQSYNAGTMTSGRFEEAVRYAKRAAELSARHLGSKHPKATYSAAQYGTALVSSARYAEGAVVLIDVLAQQMGGNDTDRGYTASTQTNLSVAFL